MRFTLRGIILCWVGLVGSLGHAQNTPRNRSAALPQAQTPDGAMASYRGAVFRFANMVGGSFDDGLVGGHTKSIDTKTYIRVMGYWTDELIFADGRLKNGIIPYPNSYEPTDSRTEYVPEVTPGEGTQFGGEHRELYRKIQYVQIATWRAMRALRAYHPKAPRALLGHLYAIDGFIAILLAEAYCSGIPLNTIQNDGTYAFRPGSTTAEVFQHAITLFDSALVYGVDSARIINFAKIGRGRAFLGLGDYAAAAQAVRSVPTDYRYELRYEAWAPNPTNWMTSSMFKTQDSAWNDWRESVADRKGLNGLPYVSSGDPRTQTILLPGTHDAPHPRVPRKYLSPGADSNNNPGTVPIVIASGIEARLIEVEVALNAKDTTWLTQLNALRTSCVPGQSCPTPVPAGTGGVAGLPLLQDPGKDAPVPDSSMLEMLAKWGLKQGINPDRVSLVFAERAYWLFLTGHRQGDLRRLVRQYKRQWYDVYPAGPWGRGISAYGHHVMLPVPESAPLSPIPQSVHYAQFLGETVEVFTLATLNEPSPRYQGCLDRKA